MGAAHACAPPPATLTPSATSPETTTRGAARARRAPRVGTGAADRAARGASAPSPTRQGSPGARGQAAQAVILPDATVPERGSARSGTLAFGPKLSRPRMTRHGWTLLLALVAGRAAPHRQLPPAPGGRPITPDGGRPPIAI